MCPPASMQAFQSTLPRGERRCRPGPCFHRSGFQSTLPRGERQMTVADLRDKLVFQSTLPRGERRGRTWATSPLTRRFNPRSRVGSDGGRGGRVVVRHCVSIHAPAWGATDAAKAVIRSDDVSIHAPAWGATISRSTLHCMLNRFNPRSRVGSDLMATGFGVLMLMFQSTLPRGERRNAFGQPFATQSFNPRSRVGSDQRRIAAACPATSFNPRSRVGSDRST